MIHLVRSHRTIEWFCEEYFEEAVILSIYLSFNAQPQAPAFQPTWRCVCLLMLRFFGRPDRANASIAGVLDVTKTLRKRKRSHTAQKSLAFAKFRHCCVCVPAYTPLQESTRLRVLMLR